MHPLLIAGLVVIGPVVLLLALAGLGHFTRGTPLEDVRSLDDAPLPIISSAAFCDLIQLAAGTPMRPGNSVELLANGDAIYPRLWDDLRGAERSITLQLYYCKPGRMANELKSILVNRARAGVHVLFLRDAFGANALPKEYVRELTDAGVQVCAFRPTHWYELHKAQSRSHIRVVVVDGCIAYTGGFGIDDQWYGDGRTPGSWRETCVRFTGPAVAQHQSIFIAGWAEAANRLLTGPALFPDDPYAPSGNVTAGSAHLAPTVGSTAGERLTAMTIACAERRLWITSAYFLPDDDFRRMLTTAAGRGVDVRVLTTGPATDSKFTLHASHARYEELLEGGVRIFEYQPSMMHAKTLVADGIWSIVGTMNIDNRSFALNDESVLVAHDHGVAATLESIFLEDLPYAKEVGLDAWRTRPFHHRVYERVTTLASRLL